MSRRGRINAKPIRTNAATMVPTGNTANSKPAKKAAAEHFNGSRRAQSSAAAHTSPSIPSQHDASLFVSAIDSGMAARLSLPPKLVKSVPC
jgi:hypothetical protein